MLNRLSSLLSLAAFFLMSAFAYADGPAVPAGGAPAAAPAAHSAGTSTIFAQIVPFALMFAVIYFLMIRPQQSKMKEQQNMLSQLKTGDEVLTASGILGKITDIADKIVTVEVAEKVRIKMLKSQISQVVKGNQI